MPDSKFQFGSARAVIRRRVRSLLRSTAKIILPKTLATRSAQTSHARADLPSPFPPLSSRSIAPLNRRSNLPRAKAIYYPLS
jgi:hypothetical protein